MRVDNAPFALGSSFALRFIDTASGRRHVRTKRPSAVHGSLTSVDGVGDVRTMDRFFPHSDRIQCIWTSELSALRTIGMALKPSGWAVAENGWRRPRSPTRRIDNRVRESLQLSDPKECATVPQATRYICWAVWAVVHA